MRGEGSALWVRCVYYVQISPSVSIKNYIITDNQRDEFGRHSEVASSIPLKMGALNFQLFQISFALRG